MIERLTSKSNEQVRLLRALGRDPAARRKNGLFLCEGHHLLGEALRSGIAVKSLFVEEDWGEKEENRYLLKQFPHVYAVPRQLIDYCATTVTPQEVLFSVALPQNTPPKPGGRYLILDSVADPGNVGTVLRSADAFSLDAVLMTGNCADPYSPKVVRATMGAAFRVPVFSFDRADAARVFSSLGVPVYTALLGGKDLRTADLRHCGVVIGNEAAGVSPELRKLCLGLEIPMTGMAESLNAGVAAGIFAWEMRRADK